MGRGTARARKRAEVSDLWWWARWPGIALLLKEFIAGIRWIVSNVGDIDFIVQRLRDPDWLRIVLDLFASPPGYLTVPSIVVGLWLIWRSAAKGKSKMTTPELVMTISAAVFFVGAIWNFVSSRAETVAANTPLPAVPVPAEGAARVTREPSTGMSQEGGSGKFINNEVLGYERGIHGKNAELEASGNKIIAPTTPAQEPEKDAQSAESEAAPPEQARGGPAAIEIGPHARGTILRGNRFHGVEVPIRSQGTDTYVYHNTFDLRKPEATAEQTKPAEDVQPKDGDEPTK